MSTDRLSDLYADFDAACKAYPTTYRTSPDQAAKELARVANVIAFRTNDPGRHVPRQEAD